MNTDAQFGCFTDIIQQDGSLVRMHYPSEDHRIATWIGIHEQYAQRFDLTRSE